MSYWIGDESVRGTIVGGEDHIGQQRYKFYTLDGKPITYKFYWFNDDTAAEAWFKKTFPEHYKDGVEMRAWDR